MEKFSVDKLIDAAVELTRRRYVREDLDPRGYYAFNYVRNEKYLRSRFFLRTQCFINKSFISNMLVNYF